MNDPLIACPKCGRTNPSDAVKCRYCGESFITRAQRQLNRTDATTQLDFVANRSKRVLIGVAAVAVIVLIALVAYTVARTKASGDGEIAAINPSAARDTALSAPGSAGATSNATSSGSDVIAYIQFLQTVEQRRNDLRQGLTAATGQLTGSALTPTAGPPQPMPGTPPTVTPPTVTPPALSGPGAQPSVAPTASTPPLSPSAATSQSGDTTAFGAYAQKWQDLLKQFGSQQWPKGCEILGNNYYRVLADYGAMLTQIENGAHTPDAVAKAESDSESKVNADALAADQALSQTCGSVGLPKSFAIAPELVPATSGAPGQPAATPTQ